MTDFPSVDPQVDWRRSPVLWVSLVLVLAFAAFAFLAPQTLSEIGDTAFAFSTTHFGWLYLSATASFIVVLAWLALSRFGEVQLGEPGEPPTYRYASWLAMIFSAGMGVGLVFWGVAEPMSHYNAPPHGLADPRTPQAAALAMQYSVFHWGVHQWANYCVVALAIAYMQFRRKERGLLSVVFRPLFGRWVDGPLGWAVDIMAVLATTFGVATTLGFGILQLNGGLHETLGVAISPVVQLLITVGITAAFLISASTKLNQGILWLSNLNMGLAALLFAFVFVAGPTVFLLNNATSTMGDVLSNAVDMSFRMDPWTEGNWANAWTVFYWAWGLSWAPFVGMFIARISRGRTIREFVTGVMLVPALVSAAWFFVFGGTALHIEVFGAGGIADIVEVDTSLALFATLQALPWGALTSILATLLIITFLVTSADSATFVLGMFTAHGVANPPRAVRLVWGILQAAIAGSLLYAGGLAALRTVSITAALPLLLLMLLMVPSLLRAILDDARPLSRADGQVSQHP